MEKINKLKQKAKQLKTEAYSLYLAYKDPRVPWYGKLFIALVVAHTFSPVDLIPDFVPVLGYLDDLIIIPLGIALAVRMVPKEVLDECRLKTKDTMNQKKPKSWLGPAIVIGIWLLIAFSIFAMFRYL